MPSAVKKARDYGDDLVVLFVEGGRSSHDEMEQFAWNKRWMGTSAMWTKEAPFRTGARGIPNCALIGADGKLLMKGHPGSLHSKIVKAIDEEIKKGKRAPEDAPKALKSAYKSLGKGDFVKAVKAAQTVVDKGGDEARAATAFLEMVNGRIAKSLKRVDWLLSQGFPMQAEEVLSELTKGLKGLDQFDAALTELDATMDSDQVKAELKADKAFSKLEEKLHESGLDPKVLKKVSKFVAKNEDSRVAARARRLLSFGG